MGKTKKVPDRQGVEGGDTVEFLICRHCGNIIAYVNHKGPNVVCCGEEMQALMPNIVDAAVEKHVPVVSWEGGMATVRVGSAPHPMLEAHHIEWIALHTEQGNQRKLLAPTGKPEAVFALTKEDKVISAYAYCNLHGIWKSLG